MTKYALCLTPIVLSLEEVMPSSGKIRSYGVSMLLRTILVLSTLVVALTFPFFGKNTLTSFFLHEINTNKTPFLSSFVLNLCSDHGGFGGIIPRNACCKSTLTKFQLLSIIRHITYVKKDSYIFCLSCRLLSFLVFVI